LLERPIDTPLITDALRDRERSLEVLATPALVAPSHRELAEVPRYRRAVGGRHHAAPGDVVGASEEFPSTIKITPRSSHAGRRLERAHEQQRHLELLGDPEGRLRVDARRFGVAGLGLDEREDPDELRGEEPVADPLADREALLR
jgi:hypothetical protein